MTSGTSTLSANRPWWRDAVVYQVYPRSFQDSGGDGVGDLSGLVSRLDHLAHLGVDVVWLCPVYRSPNDDNGYDISDYYDIHPEFGTMADMERLIAEGRRRGIRIVMDLVVNHTSDEHEWFVKSRASRENPWRDFYIWRDPVDGGPPNDMKSCFSGPAWTLDERTGQYYLHLFSRRQPDLNWQNPDVRSEVYRMMRFWLGKGIGGFRMDVIDLIGKEIDRGVTANGPRLHEFLQEMHREALSGFDVLTVGETWGATPEQAKLYSDPARKELSMVFQFEHILLDEVPGRGKWAPKPLELLDLKRVLARWQTELGSKGWNSLFWNNHDTPRIVSRWGDDGRYRVESAKMLATLLHLMKGTPYIYQGEEIGMTNVRFESMEDYRDIETLNWYAEQRSLGRPHADLIRSIRAKGRDNARTPMQWSAGPQAGFTTGTPWIRVNPNHVDINVESALADPGSVFHYYRALIRLRKERRVVVEGDFRLLLEDDPSVFAYERALGEERLLVACNFTGAPAPFTPPPGSPPGRLLLGNYVDSPPALSAVTLRPYEALVYEA